MLLSTWSSPCRKLAEREITLVFLGSCGFWPDHQRQRSNCRSNQRSRAIQVSCFCSYSASRALLLLTCHPRSQIHDLCLSILSDEDHASLQAFSTRPELLGALPNQQAGKSFQACRGRRNPGDCVAWYLWCRTHRLGDRNMRSRTMKQALARNSRR